MRHKTYILLLLLIGVASCEPEIDTPKPSSGQADFSVFVSLGNSLTAGFADNELYKSGQMVSYANIMAKQMLHTGGGEYRVPLMRDELGFGSRLRLGYNTDCLGNESLGLALFAETPDPANFQSIYQQEGPFHNLGIPGARVGHLAQNGYGVSNGYYGRFASSPSASVLEDALSLAPTFFSLWIGNNDVLGYALSGGTSSFITPADDFRVKYRHILETLTGSASRGVIASIPDITSIPLFNTLPSLGLVLFNQGQVDELNQLWGAAPKVNFQVGVNGFVVKDSGLAAGVRMLTPGELLLLTLPQDSLRCAGWGSFKPIPEQYYLSKQQVQDIGQAITEYNQIIEGFAKEFELALVNASLLLRQAATGISFDGLTFNTQFVTGGIFSLDGVHLSPRGNAIMANHFIDAINSKYGATIPRVSVTQYQGLTLP